MTDSQFNPASRARPVEVGKSTVLSNGISHDGTMNMPTDLHPVLIYVSGTLQEAPDARVQRIYGDCPDSWVRRWLIFWAELGSGEVVRRHRSHDANNMAIPLLFPAPISVTSTSYPQIHDPGYR